MAKWTPYIVYVPEEEKKEDFVEGCGERCGGCLAVIFLGMIILPDILEFIVQLFKKIFN